VQRHKGEGAQLRERPHSCERRCGRFPREPAVSRDSRGIYRNASKERAGRERERERARVAARRHSRGETVVHYFLMSNKAISMCPDQGPQVLTPSNLAGVPGVCDIFIREANPPLFSFLRRLPLPPPLARAGRRRGHVTALHPRETRDAGYAAEERKRGERKMAALGLRREG